MIATITFLTSLSFAVLYPLCFLLDARNPLKNNFHHFHLGLPAIIAGVLAAYAFTSPLSITLKAMIWVWAGLLIFITAFYWRKDSPQPIPIIITTFLGCLLFLEAQAEVIAPNFELAVAGLLAGLVFASALYAMNLGHWYLNVHGLNIIHLRRASYAFWLILVLRLIWDGYQAATATVLLRGRAVSVYTFLSSSEGIFLWIAILFGTVFPIAAMFMVKEILKLRNTQATTGVLYVILCSVLLGDIAYKYHFLKYSLFF